MGVARRHRVQEEGGKELSQHGGKEARREERGTRKCPRECTFRSWWPPTHVTISRAVGPPDGNAALAKPRERGP